MLTAGTSVKGSAGYVTHEAILTSETFAASFGHLYDRIGNSPAPQIAAAVAAGVVGLVFHQVRPERRF